MKNIIALALLVSVNARDDTKLVSSCNTKSQHIVIALHSHNILSYYLYAVHIISHIPISYILPTSTPPSSIITTTKHTGTNSSS